LSSEVAPNVAVAESAQASGGVPAKATKGAPAGAAAGAVAKASAEQPVPTAPAEDGSAAPEVRAGRVAPLARATRRSCGR